LHLVILAHYLADLQDDPCDELEWDLRAFQAAGTVTDDRAPAVDGTADQTVHELPTVAAMLPSLHLNLAAAYVRLGRLDEARDHIRAAQVHAPALAEDGYGTWIRRGIARLAGELGS
jgi:hypothetical protein